MGRAPFLRPRRDPAASRTPSGPPPSRTSRRSLATRGVWADPRRLPPLGPSSADARRRLAALDKTKGCACDPRASSGAGAARRLYPLRPSYLSVVWLKSRVLHGNFDGYGLGPLDLLAKR